MPDRWFMNALVEYGMPRAYRAEAVTDYPCHLWLRWSANKPWRHPRPVKVRGVWLIGDVYFCFTAWHDVEQEEAGDTLAHTFIVPNWLACQTRWMYLHGEIGGVASPSESPIWGRHLFYEHEFKVILVSHPNDSVDYHAGVITSAPPLEPQVQLVGRWGIPADTVGGAFRFRDLQLPKYAEILNAILGLTYSLPSTKVPVHCQVSFENLPDAADFYGINIPAFTARWNNRFHVVDWDNMPPWYAWEWHDSPDISPGLQAIVNKAGFVPSNACVIFWDDYLQRTPWQAYAVRFAYATYYWPEYAPHLVVNYNHWQVEEVLP